MCKHFKTYEFLPKRIYELYNDDRGLRHINPKIPLIMDYLREELGARITINDWYWGGDFQQRGRRTIESDVYKELSDHSDGNAVDFHVEGKTANEVRERILGDLCEDLKVLGVTAIEDEHYAPTWVHISVADFSKWNYLPQVNGIKILKP